MSSNPQGAYILASLDNGANWEQIWFIAMQNLLGVHYSTDRRRWVMVGEDDTSQALILSSLAD